MYEMHWQLERRPFESVADTAFYYPSECHQGALLKLRYAIESAKGAALLAGDHGAGKTMIVEMLREQLAEECAPFAHIVFPQMPPADLLAYIADELCPAEVNTGLPSIQHSVRRIQKHLAANTAAGRHAVLVIDEAHLIDDPAAWEALRLLLNFQSGPQPDLTMLLVGQLPLLSTIERMPAWDERLGVKCLLRPLNLEETACYLQHRLKVAGGQTEIFTAEAIDALYRLSGGLARRVNRLADLALVIGYAEELHALSTKEIEAVCGEIVSIAQP